MPNAMQVFRGTFSNLREQSKQMAGNLFPYGGYGSPWGFPSFGGQQSEHAEEDTSDVADLRERMKELEGELKKLRKKK